VWWLVCGGEIFPGSLSVRYSIPNNVNQKCFLEVSNSGFASTLLFCKSTVINGLRRKYQHSLNMSSVCIAILMHVSMCIFSLFYRFSIQVITIGTDSGVLGFRCLLA
jgi:hypothetical protein